MENKFAAAISLLFALMLIAPVMASEPASTIFSISATSGDEFYIKLISNPSTGYDWIPAIADPSIAKYIGSERILDNSASSTGMVGQSSYFSYKFLALKSGSTLLSMSYARPWENSTISDSKTYLLTVNQDGPSPATAMPPYPGGSGEYYTVNLQPGWNLFSVPLSGYSGVSQCPYGAECAQTAVPVSEVMPASTQTTQTVTSSVSDTVTSSSGSKASAGTGEAIPVTVPMPAKMIAYQRFPTLTDNGCYSKTAWYYDPNGKKYSQVSVSQLEPGKGYWLYTASACSMTYYGSIYGDSSYSQQILPGWNMIGAPYDPLTVCKMIGVRSPDDTSYNPCSGAGTTPLSDIIGSCDFKTAYYFDVPTNSWVNTDQLQSGKGYFVKSSNACSMYSTQVQPPIPTATIPPLPPGGECNDQYKNCNDGYKYLYSTCNNQGNPVLIDYMQDPCTGHYSYPTTTSVPIACPAIYMPVCGVDGKTYGNECEAKVAGVAIKYTGECGTSTAPEDPRTLKSTYVCKANADCMLASADCCGCGSGGKEFAINAAYRATLEKYYATVCKDQVCPSIYLCLPNAKAACVSEVCQITYPTPVATIIPV